MRSLLSVLLGQRAGGSPYPDGGHPEAVALLSHCPPGPGPDLNRWAAALAPHVLHLLQATTTTTTTASYSPSSHQEDKEDEEEEEAGYGRTLAELPRWAVVALLARDELRVESEYQVYLLAAAHAELHTLRQYRAEQDGRRHGAERSRDGGEARPPVSGRKPPTGRRDVDVEERDLAMLRFTETDRWTACMREAMVTVLRLSAP